MSNIKLDFFKLRRLAGQFLPTRRPKQAVVGLITGVLCCLLIYRRLNREEAITSAISCKSDFVATVIKDEQERKDYLFPMGVNFHDLENDYFYYVTTMTHNCKDQAHIGPQEDGGWEVCLEKRFFIKQPCLIYSFGIANDFRFEIGMDKLLGCELHAFDPSMEVEPFKFSANGYYHNYGVHSQNTKMADGKWSLKRLSDIMKDLGHTGRTIDYMKMDVEFSEWPVLYDLISTGLIRNVRQLALELHTPEMDIHHRPDNKCTWTRLETLAFMMRALIDLKNLGFSVFYSRTNHRTKFVSPITGSERYCCHDLHLVNLHHDQNAWVRE